MGHKGGQPFLTLHLYYIRGLAVSSGSAGVASRVRYCLSIRQGFAGTRIEVYSVHHNCTDAKKLVLVLVLNSSLRPTAYRPTLLV
jgi:hypothetical protein